jgi:hypothetical protein
MTSKNKCGSATYYKCNDKQRERPVVHLFESSYTPAEGPHDRNPSGNRYSHREINRNQQNKYQYQDGFQLAPHDNEQQLVQ